MTRDASQWKSILARTAFVAASVLTAVPVAAQTCFDVQLYAGIGVGDGLPGLQAIFRSPRQVAADGAGNLYVADARNARIRRYDAATGTVTTVAGTGAPGTPRDGELALLSALNEPSGVALDAVGNIYIADTGSFDQDAIWRVSPDGVIHRFAGSGVRTGTRDGDKPSQPGNDPSDDLNDGQLALFATLNRPLRLAVDGAGNVLVADFGNQRIRKIDPSGRISTLTDGIEEPIGMALGPNGTLYVANRAANRIVAVSPNGQKSQFAGSGQAGNAGDNGNATNADLDHPGDVSVASDGSVYIADTNNNRIRKVANDVITAVAGSGLQGGADGAGFLARFNHPGGLLVLGGTLVVADTDNNRLRRYDIAGDLVSTTAGRDNLPGGDGGPASAAILDRPAGVAIDGSGVAYVTEHDSFRVRRIDPAGTITTVINAAGATGDPADNVPGATARLMQPTGLAMDGAGNLYVADARAHRVVRLDAGGILHHFAGTGAGGFGNEGGAATNVPLNVPLRVAVGPDGVYIADFNNHRIRRVALDGTMATFAGSGDVLNGGFADGAATQARFNQPSGLVFDAAGNLYVADFSNHRVRKIDPTGLVTTIAGTGVPGNSGDGLAAGAAALNGPTDVAIGSDGALLIVDQLNNKVRRIAPDPGGSISGAGVITTVVGSGRPGYNEGTGLVASLLSPTDVAVDGLGNLLIADRGNNRVRLARPATNCSNGGGGARPCSTNAECIDTDVCTVDVCGGNGVCTTQPSTAPECLPSCAREPNGCIPGGGSRRTDCLAETLVKAPLAIKRGIPRPQVRCSDNDPTCDHDPTPGQCGFLVAWCLNQKDPRLACSAAGVTRLVAPGASGVAVRTALTQLAPQNASQVGRTVTFSPALTTPDACTPLQTLTVRLRKRGRRPGTLVVKTTAVAGRKKDPDAVKFTCRP
jgi:sugar lactone lactonase YvrE